MPFSATLALSDFSDEKLQALPAPSSSPLPRSPRSLSLAVMTAMRQPARWNDGNSVSMRRNFGIVHHHLFPAVGIEEVVAADAVLGRRPAGDDREVVRVGEGRHDAVGQKVRALGQHLAEPRRAAGLDGALDVAGLRAVDADHDGGLARQAVAAAVDGDLAAASVLRLSGAMRTSYSAANAGPPLLTRISSSTSRTASSAPSMCSG